MSDAAAGHDPGATPLLRADGLSKSYRMGREPLRVIHDCTLHVNAGEFVAIMGKSGSGKSTLLHLLGALDIPDAGQVYFESQPAFGVGERHRVGLRRYRFGFIFQFYHLLPELNVLENALMTRMIGSSTLGWWLGERRQARSDALAVLDRVGLSGRLRHRPSELSGGERQRVAIARALVHRPAVVFADEPTGNLDAAAGRQLMDLLLELNREGQTFVMVTHDASIAALAHRTLRLDEGKLVNP